MKQILIVDDSRVLRKVARAILEKLHFETCEAENGEDAIALCRRQLPDGILLDSNMPVMNGIELLEELQKGGPNPTFGFLTTEGSDEMRDRAKNAGARFFITKPFSPEAFQEALTGIL